MRITILALFGVAVPAMMADTVLAKQQCPYGYERNGPYCVPIARRYRERFYGYHNPPGPRVYGGYYESHVDSRVESRVGAGGCPPGFSPRTGGCVPVRR